MRLSAVLIVAATAVGAASVSAAATQPHKILVPRGIATDQLAFRPHRIYLSGDGTFVVEGLKWRRYGGRTATATGRASISDCEPNCVEGSRYHLPVKIRLGKVVHCRGNYFYSRLHYFLYGDPPAGLRRERSMTLQLVNRFLEPAC